MHREHTSLSLYNVSFSVSPQKMQAGWCFLRMIHSLSVKISTGSSMLMSSVLRSSLGMTILPSLSTCLTIPVDFMGQKSPVV